MADETAGGGTATTTTTTPAADAREIKARARQREPRFSVADLLARPVIMEEDGYSAFQVGLAFAGADVDPDAEYTRAEIRQRIDSALSRPVEHVDAPDQAEEG